jgi:osmotically-inducible protein OsmY
MQKSRTMAAAVLLAVSAWTGAGQTRPGPKAVAAAKSASRPRTSDAQIEAAIRAKLAKSPKLGPEKFQVHVQGGVATFEGKTDVVQHKGTATRMAKSAGALAVNNHIQVSDAAKQKAASNLETGRRRVQVKRGDARSDGSSTTGSQVRNR